MNFTSEDAAVDYYKIHSNKMKHLIVFNVPANTNAALPSNLDFTIRPTLGTSNFRTDLTYPSFQIAGPADNVTCEYVLFIVYFVINVALVIVCSIHIRLFLQEMPVHGMLKSLHATSSRPCSEVDRLVYACGVYSALLVKPPALPVRYLCLTVLHWVPFPVSARQLLQILCLLLTFKLGTEMKSTLTMYSSSAVKRKKRNGRWYENRLT